ncbi:MAG: hypothetical protein ACOX6T_06515 [Myxococcales bacterium]
MRALLGALTAVLPAVVFAQVPPPPPPLPVAAPHDSPAAMPFVAPRAVEADDKSAPSAAVQEVQPRPVEATPVAPPPPSIAPSAPVAPAPVAPAAAPPAPAPVDPALLNLPFVEARELGPDGEPVAPPTSKLPYVQPREADGAQPAAAEPEPATRTITVKVPPPSSEAPAAAAPGQEASAEAAAGAPVEDLGPAGGDEAERASAGPAQAAAPVEGAAEGEKAGKKDEDDDDDDFVKGELSSVGMTRMESRSNHVFVAGGYNRIGKAHYVLVRPQVGLAIGDFSLGLGVPLNFEVFNSGYPKDPAPGENHVIGVSNAGSLRKEDWDEVADFAQILTYLTYGRKEDPLYLDIGQRHSSTIGHGAIMRRYASNIDVNLTRVGAQLDAHNDYIGVELMTNDIARWNLIGGLAFIKPLSIVGLDSWFARNVSIGVSAVVDRDAPTSLQMMPEPPCPVPGACAPANVTKVDDDNRLAANRSAVALAGIDLELKLVKTSFADIKPYIDYSKLMYRGDEGEGGGGLTIGVLGRFNLGVVTTHAFRLVAEYRSLGEGYRPGYFDTFYEVDKFLDGGTGGVKPGDGRVPLTKLQATVGAGRPPKRSGYYFEASYGVREAIGLTLALEGQSELPEKNFIAHLEVPALSFLKFFGTLYKRGFTEMSTIFDLDEHAVAFAGVRLKVLPILFVNARAFKSFELDAYKSATTPLGTLQYRNVTGYAGDIELGFEF